MRQIFYEIHKKQLSSKVYDNRSIVLIFTKTVPTDTMFFFRIVRLIILVIMY